MRIKLFLAAVLLAAVTAAPSSAACNSGDINGTFTLVLEPEYAKGVQLLIRNPSNGGTNMMYTVIAEQRTYAGLVTLTPTIGAACVNQSMTAENATSTTIHSACSGSLYLSPGQVDSVGVTPVGNGPVTIRVQYGLAGTPGAAPQVDAYITTIPEPGHTGIAFVQVPREACR